MRGRRALPRADVVIRPMGDVDSAGVAELVRDGDMLHARLWPSYFRAPGASARSFAERGSESEVVLVAERGGDLCGMIHAQIFDAPDLPTLVPRRRLHVENLVVRRSARRKGLGARLVREVVGWGRERGVQEIVLVVWQGNRAAERFYRALGFRVVHHVLGMEV